MSDYEIERHMAKLRQRLEHSDEMESLLQRLRAHLDLDVEDEDGPYWIAEIDFVLRKDASG